MISMKMPSLVQYLWPIFLLAVCGVGYAQDAPDVTATSRPASDDSREVLHFRATLASPGGELPFGLEIIRAPNGKAAARIVNGPEVIELADVRFSEDRLKIDIRHYDATIEARVSESAGMRDAIRRHYIGRWKKRVDLNTWTELPFEAVEDVPYRFRPGPRVEGELEISEPVEGRWLVRFEKSDDPAIGEFHRTGDGEIVGTFLTATGDYRFLAGDYEAGRLRLSAFDGAHAMLFDARLDESGRLNGDFWSRDVWHETWTAERDPDASLPDGFGLATPVRGVELSTVKFRGVDGKLYSLDDDTFRGKPRIIEVFGTWCPNCHDAAGLLNDLHHRYSPQGLVVIGVAFEATGQFERDARQVRRFVDRYDVKYPILLGGKRPKEETRDAFPLLDRIYAYPTTLFINRKGEVIAVHTGFSGPATGEAHLLLRAEFERRIREMLDEQVPSP
ncbi:MAG: TlpA family protein disulfide reductase [Phycisphaerales bacterium]|nr:TlpA family protein disulfide reductase [Phycisphaerales bacterium]MCB9854162.1 TlpA family protein disulfide reductase [Phycisphaerales bacterium]MCB9864702.1 TlpA family protein disulfide reductase [Phycisphaerales bacterium]